VQELVIVMAEKILGGSNVRNCLYLFNELFALLRDYVEGVGLVLLVLVHLLATDVRPLLQQDPDEVLQPEHVSLIKRRQLPLIETGRERH